MSKKGIPYDITNFFLDKNKCLFYIDLKNVQDKKTKMYNLCKKYEMTKQHMKLVLIALKYYELIDFCYEHEFKSFLTVYTKKGLRLRHMLVNVSRFLKCIGVWNNVRLD